jgi:hypothetical protein
MYIIYYRKGKEAPTGFEPVHKGFADLSLTSWVRRLKRRTYPIRKGGFCPVVW